MQEDEGRHEEHRPTIMTIRLTEAQKRKMYEPEGAKLERKLDREDAETASDVAGLYGADGTFIPADISVSRSRRPQREQESHGPWQPPPDLNSFEVRGGCSAPLSSPTACPATWPAWPRCRCCAVPLLAACLPACH